MFGYVEPYKMELKIKDFEKFKAYYCGLCKSIKLNYGNIPRVTINYDMTFLAILLDSFFPISCVLKKERCIIHPLKKRVIITNNSALDYAAFCNITLANYKLLDNFNDDKSIISKLNSNILKLYVNKAPKSLKMLDKSIKNNLLDLYNLENNYENKILDEVCHPFAHLTGILLTSYDKLKITEEETKTLYWLGYNLGKWIYLIDALDDLKDDMLKNKFNVINNILNKDNKPFKEFYESIKDRIYFVLVTCARNCSENFNKLNLNKNKELLTNILDLGLMEKINEVLNKISKHL